MYIIKEEKNDSRKGSNRRKKISFPSLKMKKKKTHEFPSLSQKDKINKKKEEPFQCPNGKISKKISNDFEI